MVRGVLKIFSYVLSMSKVFILLLFVIFLPRIFVGYINTKTYGNITSKNANFRLGLENITQALLKNVSKAGNTNLRIGLITNQTGKDQLGRRNIDVLLAKNINIKKIFVPEHGLNGNISAEKKVSNSIDKQTNIPVLSLYPGDRTKILDKKTLKDIDVLMFDMQDAGMRHYTYITTMFQAIEAASKNKKPIVVLDRPSILGPVIEGPLVDKNFKSGISFASIPIRYGMTVGELALYYNNKINTQKAKLYIVPMKGYKRNCKISNRLLSHLSPNIQSINSCHGYSFLGILGEIRPFDVGIGSPDAFQVILLEDKIEFSHQKWKKIHAILESLGIKNHFYRFFDKRKNNYCSGLKIQITNINQTPSFKALVSILKFFKESKLELKFSKYFDKVAGTDKLREFFEDKISWRELSRHVNKNLYFFYNNASKYFIYKPFPRVEYL